MRSCFILPVLHSAAIKMSGVETLVEMGFLKNRAEKAWAIMGHRGVQAAMEWLLEHNEDSDIDEPYQPPEGYTLGEEKNSAVSETTISDDKKTDVPLKQDSPEEKAAKLQLLQEKINQRRREKEELERKREIEMEKTRRKDGRDLSKIKSEIQWKEAQKQADIRRREKREDMIARQRVKEQIAKDRADKKAALEKEKIEVAEVKQPVPAALSPSSSKTEYSHARLQIRLPSGSQLVQKFGSQEQLSAVRLYVELNRTDGSSEPFSLMTAFPKKVFTDEEQEMTLQALGLTPSAVLIVTKAR